MARDHFDLGGKIAVVAGASRGIGQAIAVILGEMAAAVLYLVCDASSYTTDTSIVVDGGYFA
jgi:NAD(P)-dependent dehydrogenase (short-subunit alcohol dehydrogenase family)